MPLPSFMTHPIVFKQLARTTLVLGLASLSLASHALPLSNPKPGGVAIIPLVDQQYPMPSVTYNNKPVAVVSKNNVWHAVLGIDLKQDTKQPQRIISHIKGFQSETLPFVVKPHDYRVQRLTIKNKNKVNPNKKSLNRIIKEQALIERLKNTFSALPQHAKPWPQTTFMRPTTGRDSGRFGLKRFINKQKRNPHSGMDIAAPRNRSIRATATGTVLHTGNFFFSGNVVYIDHGLGLISMYAHMNKIQVKKGQKIKPGQIIGKVGSTGRATGPHLHWSMYLNGNAVDPALFIKTKR